MNFQEQCVNAEIKNNTPPVKKETCKGQLLLVLPQNNNPRGGVSEADNRTGEILQEKIH